MGKLTKVLKFEDENGKILTDQIPDGDETQADKLLAVITSIGPFGIGKTFVQNILLGVIQNGESYFEGNSELLEVFPLETSVMSETQGIDMFSEYLEPPLAAEDMVIALWDTEGLSNPNHLKDHDITIFRLSAYFSQVLIYNVEERLSMENMDKMQVFLEEIRTPLGDAATRFGTLIIMVRDADGKFGYDWEGGKAYHDHLRAQGQPGGQTELFFRELEDTFSSVSVFMMPPPNKRVMSKANKVTHMKDIDMLFRESLCNFTKRLLHEIVKPGIVGGDVLRVRDLKLQLTKFAERFLQSRSVQTSFTLANLVKERHISKEVNICFAEYQHDLLENRGWFQAEATRIERHNELKRKTLDKFKQAIVRHYLEVRIVEVAVSNLDKLLDERFRAYNEAHKPMWTIGSLISSVISSAMGYAVNAMHDG